MEAARPRERGRRLRRGTVDRPLNTRLVRVGLVVVAPALVALLFSVSTTGTLPPSPFQPLFDARAAGAHASTLSAIYPSRVPGTPEAEEAARWFRETMSSFGLATEEDVWTEDVAGLGDVVLRNVVATVPGRSSQTIVVVAHRDNVGAGEARGDNASGTAALLELARAYAPQDTGGGPLPERTLVLVSTDAGAYGGAGAARFADQSALARDALAVVVLDGIGRPGRPRLAIAGDEPVTPARALVSTAAARVREQTGVEPELPSLATQLVGLGLPFAAEEQGRFLARGLAAITLTTASAPDVRPGAGVQVAEQRLGQLGRATEALVGSLDASVGRAFRTPDSLFFGDRAASGWTVRLSLVLLVVPYALGVVDLVVRSRRRRLPFRPALRALRARALVWLSAGLLLWLGGLVGILPTGAPLPPPPFTEIVDDVPLSGVLLLAIVLGMIWAVARGRLAPQTHPAAEERLAGHVAALGLVGAVALVLALTAPYALVFVLPSLYAWLWIPLEGRTWKRAALFALGLAGPVLVLGSLASQLPLPLLDVPVYLASLVTVGYIAPTSVVLVLLWGAAAAQVAALSFGRYAPYAAGREPPPAGVLRQAVRGLLARRATRA